MGGASGGFRGGVGVGAPCMYVGRGAEGVVESGAGLRSARGGAVVVLRVVLEVVPGWYSRCC